MACHDQLCPPAAASTRLLPALLLLLTVFGPISMDLYLPLLPALTAELGAATSVAQLTITACLIGLAAGQLIAGPLSDRFGRAASCCTSGSSRTSVTSLLCAVSPTCRAADRGPARAGRWQAGSGSSSPRPRVATSTPAAR